MRTSSGETSDKPTSKSFSGPACSRQRRRPESPGNAREAEGQTLQTRKDCGAQRVIPDGVLSLSWLSGINCQKVLNSGGDTSVSGLTLMALLRSCGRTACTVWLSQKASRK